MARMTVRQESWRGRVADALPHCAGYCAWGCFRYFESERCTGPGGLRGMLSSPHAKNILLPFFGKMWFHLAIPSRSEGRFGRSSPDVGRDAVDATLSCAHVIAGRSNP